MLVIIKKRIQGNSLVVQWLGPGIFTAMSLSSIPDLGTKMQQATRRGQKQDRHILGDMGKQLQWLKLKQCKLGQIQTDGIKRGFWKKNFQDLVSLNHTLNQVVKDADMLFPNTFGHLIYKHIVSIIVVILIHVFSSGLCIFLRTEVL